MGMCERWSTKMESKSKGKMREWMFFCLTWLDYKSFQFPWFHHFWSYRNLSFLCILFLLFNVLTLHFYTLTRNMIYLKKLTASSLEVVMMSDDVKWFHFVSIVTWESSLKFDLFPSSFNPFHLHNMSFQIVPRLGKQLQTNDDRMSVFIRHPFLMCLDFLIPTNYFTLG